MKAPLPPIPPTTPTPPAVRPSPLRYMLLLPVVLFGVATILASAGLTPHPSITVSNIQNAACHANGGGETCAFSATVQVNNYTFKTGTATFITTDLLVGQWTNLTSANDQNPSGSVAFLHDGLVCTGPETTLAVYDGFTDTGTLVASTQLNPPVTLLCQ